MSVDVFIPTWNSGKTLKATLNSLVTAEVPISRLLILDVSSTDDTFNISKTFCEKHGIPLVFRAVKRGLGYARYVAQEIVETPYYVSLDADILLTPGWYKQLKRRLDEDPTCAFASSMIMFGDKGTVVYRIHEFKRHLCEFQPCVGSTLIRRSHTDFTCIKDVYVGEDSCYVRHLIDGGGHYIVGYSVVSHHPRTLRGDLEHLYTWGRGAREIGYNFFVQTGRLVLSLGQGFRYVAHTGDPCMIGWIPLRQAMWYLGYLSYRGPIRGHYDLREEKRIFMVARRMALNAYSV